MQRILCILCGLFILTHIQGQTFQAQEGPIKTFGDTVKTFGDTVKIFGDTLITHGDKIKTPGDTIDEMTPGKAYEYLNGLLKYDSLWRTANEPMRISLERLLYNYHEPFDSVQQRLHQFPYDSIRISRVAYILNDSLPVLWLNDSTIVIDTVSLKRDPYILKFNVIDRSIDTIITDTSYIEQDQKQQAGSGDGLNRTADSLQMQDDSLSPPIDSVQQSADTFQIPRYTNIPDSIPEGSYFAVRRIDTTIQVPDTISERLIDTLYLQNAGLTFYRVNGLLAQAERTLPERKFFKLASDSMNLLIPDTTFVLVADTISPFYRVPDRRLPDSLRMAVNQMLDFSYLRDSIPLYIQNASGEETPFWLSARPRTPQRYWIKNRAEDSVTVWMGNPEKYDMTILLEDDVSISRIRKIVIDDIPISQVTPQVELAKTHELEEIPIYWSYDFSSSFALNQTYLSNWSKGGENSLSTMLDIKGEAKYTNKEVGEWTSDARLQYGSIITEENGMRTNTDMLEFNSQYNRVIRKKIDFSALFYMKNQLASGYNYPNDSVVVSKFLNPTTFTLGVGVEYKPFKNTLINFSPLSYKNTFVLDTANIDQTNHGIDEDKRARQEMGGQLLIKNKASLWDGLSVSNSIRLFSNYFDKPQNVDVDWEMNLNKRINWYFSVSLNLHLIYDDNIRFPVYDTNGETVLLPDGKVKKVPKMQFKEFVGLTFAFKF